MPATPIPSPSPTAGMVDEILSDVAGSAGSSITDAFQEVADSTGLSALLKDMTGLTLPRLISIVVLVVCCVLIIKMIQHGVERILQRGKIEKSLHTFVRTSVNILLWFLFALIVASSLNIDVTSLVAVLSVAGLAVSLAIQGTLSNLAGGIQVLLSKPFKVGDYIETDSVSGTVQEISMSHTKLLTLDNKVIFVPNSEIAAAKITNYNAEERRRVDLTFSTSYDDPTERVVNAIRSVVDVHPLVLRDPEPFVRLSAFGDSAVEYTVRVWCRTEDYWTLHFDLLEQVRAAFDRAGVELTYPHLNVHMVEQGKERSGAEHDKR